MAEEILTLMADLDFENQVRMSGWYDALKMAGFGGQQTPGLPYHISMATFSVDKEAEAIEITKKAAEEFSSFSLDFSHIGIFPGGKVLFCAPERNAQIDALHEACDRESIHPFPWTPHATMLIDEPDVICAALPVFLKSFSPFSARIARLHLCAFWPTREILSLDLKKTDGK